MYLYALCKDGMAPYAAGSALYLGAATAAGTAVTLVVHPIYLVKTRLRRRRRQQCERSGLARAGGGECVL